MAKTTSQDTGNATQQDWLKRMGAHRRLYEQMRHNSQITVTPEQVLKPYYGKRWGEAVRRARRWQSKQPRRGMFSNRPSRQDLSAGALQKRVGVRLSRHFPFRGATFRSRVYPRISGIGMNPDHVALGSFPNAVYDRQSDPQPLRTLAHEITHTMEDPSTQSSYAIRKPFGRVPNVTNLNRRYITSPSELLARLANIKRRYAKATGHLVDSPVRARKAIKWMVQRNKNIDSGHNGDSPRAPGWVTPNIGPLLYNVMQLDERPEAARQLGMDKEEMREFRRIILEAMPGMVRSRRSPARRHYG